MQKLVIQIIMKAGAALALLGASTFLGKKASEDKKKYDNMKNNPNGK
jgi:hypothetical protein